MKINFILLLLNIVCCISDCKWTFQRCVDYFDYYLWIELLLKLQYIKNDVFIWCKFTATSKAIRPKYIEPHYHHSIVIWLMYKISHFHLVLYANLCSNNVDNSVQCTWEKTKKKIRWVNVENLSYKRCVYFNSFWL